MGHAKHKSSICVSLLIYKYELAGGQVRILPTGFFGWHPTQRDPSKLADNKVAYESGPQTKREWRGMDFVRGCSSCR